MIRFRCLLLLIAIVFLSSFSLGQTLVYTRVVQGNLFLPPGTPAANSRMRFQLKYCAGQNGRVPVNPGNPPGPTGIIVGAAPFDVTVQSDGSWRTQVYGNDQIICGTDMTGPSRWLIQPVFNGEAGTGVEYQIQSCGAASPCNPFLPDSAPRCSLTVVTDCAVETGNPDQPDTTVTVNAQMAVPNAINFGNVLLPPTNGKIINFLINGNQAGAYLPGNGNSATCLSGTGSYVLCGGGGTGGGVSGATAGGGLVLSGSTLGMIRTCNTNQYLSWNGSAWICTTLTGGGGGGAGFPTTPQYDLFTSTGAGAAQASGILGGSGFLKGQVILATGDVTSAAAPFPLAPNASVEYFPSGATFGGINVGATNGLAAYFSHSGKSGSAPGYGNGGIMLGGGNNSGVNYQVYLDCESAPSLNCDFKVPITVNGAGVGSGGGGAGFPTIPAPNLYASNGSAAATDSGVLGQSGFLRAYVLESTGTGNPSPFSVPNGSVEYFPTGATYGGLNIGATNGVAIHFSHSSHTGQAGNGGVALGGANSSGAANTYQIFLDCEQVGCDFKVPVTLNGGALGGGGGGGTITGATVNGGLVVSGTTLGLVTTCTANQYLSWSGSAWVCTTAPSGGGGSGTVSSGTAGHFTWYAAAGTTVSSNANLDDDLTTPSTITSQETIAAPQINVNGAVGTGIAMTGAGGTLPTPASGQGGIGIGPGNVPQFYSNGGAWTAIGSGTGGGVTNPIVFTGASLTAPASGSGGFGVMTGGMPAIAQNGGSYVAIKLPQVNAVALGPNVAAWNVNDTAPAATANGRNVSWQLASGTGNISAQLVGDGSTNCLSGQGTYVSCGGAGGGTAVQVNGVAVGATANFNASTTTPPIPTNGKIITFANSGTSVTAALVGDGSVNCLSGTGTYVACGAGGGGSGTVSPNSGTAGALAYYAAAGGSTTVAPVTATIATNGTGVNIGTGVLQFGTGLTAADVNFTRPSPNLITIGSGTGQTGGYLNLNNSNSCSVTADTAFTGGNICQRTLPTGGAARPWIVHCVIPWNFTGGSGTANVVFGFNANAAPASASIFTTVLWGPGVSGGPVFGTALVPASAGQTPLITANALSLTDQTSIYAAFIDGVVSTTSGGVVYIYATTSNGTAQIRAGSYCTYQ